MKNKNVIILPGTGEDENYLIIRHSEGHMGSEKFHQPYKKFPLIISLLSDQFCSE